MPNDNSPTLTKSKTTLRRELVTNYINEINQDFNMSKQIVAKINSGEAEMIDMLNYAVIIAMCIKYETFASDLLALLTQRSVEYNRPWYYTRVIAKKLKVTLEPEYQVARDAWSYYNTLKHVNSHSRVESLVFSQTYHIENSWDAIRFVHRALIALLTKFL